MQEALQQSLAPDLSQAKLWLSSDDFGYASLHPTIESLDWGKIYSFIQSHISDPYLRNRTINAVENIRTTLGEHLISLLIKHRCDYLWNFTAIFTWNPAELISLSESITALQDEKNFDSISSKIKNLTEGGRFSEFITLLNTAKILLPNFHIDFAPSIDEFRKYPDLHLVDRATNSEAYVEISELRNSQEHVKASEMMSLIIHYQHITNLNFTGQIQRILSIEEIKIMLTKITKLIDDKLPAFTTIKHSQKEMFDLTIRSSFNTNLTSQDKRNNQNAIQLNGPFYKTNEWQRFRDKIYKEQKQLKPGFNNLLVIWAPDGLIDAQYSETDVSEVVIAELNRYPHISGIIVIATYPNGSFTTNKTSDFNLFIDPNSISYYWCAKFKDSNESFKKQVLDSIDKYTGKAGVI